jgi:hypothetical protein
MDVLYKVPEGLQETLNLVDELRRRLKEEMYGGLASSKGAGVNTAHVESVVKLTNASTQLSREIRNWFSKQAQQVKNASRADNIQTAIKFIQSLPTKTRLDIYRELENKESKRNDRIRLMFPRTDAIDGNV